jgi:hypothetical protein
MNGRSGSAAVHGARGSWFPGLELAGYALTVDLANGFPVGPFHLLGRYTVFLRGAWGTDEEIPRRILDRGREILVPSAFYLGPDDFAYRVRKSDVVSAHAANLCHDMLSAKADRFVLLVPGPRQVTVSSLFQRWLDAPDGKVSIRRLWFC